MVAVCATPIKARLMRVIRLDTCGVPVSGAGSLIVSKGFVSIEIAPEYEDGQEFIVKNANGDFCVNEKDPNTLKRVGMTMNFCAVDPDLISIVAGERVLTTGGPATGTGVAFGEGLLTARFSLEVWQPLAGAAACAGGVQQYVYWAFPNVGNPKVGNFSFQNAPFSFQMTGDTKAAATQWGDGPTSPSYLPSALTTDEHFAFNISAVPPPAETGCGAAVLTLS